MNSAFKVHKLNERGLEKADDIAQIFDDLLSELDTIVGSREGRLMAIVYTKLEEACFFAKKAVAVQAENQEAEAE